MLQAHQGFVAANAEPKNFSQKVEKLENRNCQTEEHFRQKMEKMENQDNCESFLAVNISPEAAKSSDFIKGKIFFETFYFIIKFWLFVDALSQLKSNGK